MVGIVSGNVVGVGTDSVGTQPTRGIVLVEVDPVELVELLTVVLVVEVLPELDFLLTIADNVLAVDVDEEGTVVVLLAPVECCVSFAGEECRAREPATKKINPTLSKILTLMSLLLNCLKLAIFDWPMRSSF